MKAFTRRHFHILFISIGVLAAIVLFYILNLNGIGIPCLFHRITGLLCPGCGNSRAALALLRLDFFSALKYNLLFPVEFFYIAWVYFFCCRNYLSGGHFSYKPPVLVVDVIILILVLIWWIVRNLL